ncbi:MAG: ABC transporter transmembrane domain-containing protein [Alphaproteobacteria bacterium]
MPFSILNPSPPRILPRVVASELPARLWPMLWLFIKPRWLWVLAASIPPMLNRALFVSGSYAAKLIADAALAAEAAHQDIWTQVFPFLLLFIGLMTGVFVVQGIGWAITYRTRFPLLADMRQTVFSFVQRHSAIYFDNNLSGKIAYKTAVLPEQMIWLLEWWWFQLMPALGIFLTAALYLTTVSAVFGLPMLGWLAMYFGVCMMSGRLCAKRAGEHNEAKTQLTGRVVDIIINIKNVIFFAAHEREDATVNRNVTATLAAQRRLFLNVIFLMRSAQHIMTLLMWTGLYTGLVYAWSRHIITPGDFVMMSTLGTMIAARSQELGDTLPDLFRLSRLGRGEHRNAGRAARDHR